MLVFAGSEFENKNSFAKKFECSKQNSLPPAKKFLDFPKRFSGFAKGIYGTCDRNFFNLITISVVFNSIIHITFTFCLQ